MKDFFSNLRIIVAVIESVDETLYCGTGRVLFSVLNHNRVFFSPTRLNFAAATASDLIIQAQFIHSAGSHLDRADWWIPACVKCLQVSTYVIRWVTSTFRIVNCFWAMMWCSVGKKGSGQIKFSQLVSISGILEYHPYCSRLCLKRMYLVHILAVQSLQPFDSAHRVVLRNGTHVLFHRLLRDSYI